MVEVLNHSVIHPDKKVKNAVIFLHGYGANGDDLIGIGNLWSNLLPNTIFLSPNAPFKCPWGGSAFQWFELTSISPENIGKGLLKAGPYLNKYVDHIAKAVYDIAELPLNTNIQFMTIMASSMPYIGRG